MRRGGNLSTESPGQANDSWASDFFTVIASNEMEATVIPGSGMRRSPELKLRTGLTSGCPYLWGARPFGHGGRWGEAGGWKHDGSAGDQVSPGRRTSHMMRKAR